VAAGGGRELMSGSNGGNGGALLSLPRPIGDLFAIREASLYNAAEQEFSRYIERKLQKLLKGEINRLPLLRRYYQEPDRLAAPVPPYGLDRDALRLPVVEEMLIRVLVFLQTGMPGGPIAQDTVDSHVIERQLHTTRFPHILIERIDTFEAGSGMPLQTEWAAQRAQNQHVDTRINRVLDLANLGFEFFRAAR
jgi:hypothetical protein